MKPLRGFSTHCVIPTDQAVKASPPGGLRPALTAFPNRPAPGQPHAAARRLTPPTTTDKQGTNNPLSDLLRQLNSALRGWTAYFRHGVSKATFGYLADYTWHRVYNWLRRKHPHATWKFLRRRYLATGSWSEQGGIALLDCGAVKVSRYRYRGAAIPTPWDGRMTAMTE